MGPRDRGGIRHNSHSPKSTTGGMVQRAGRRFEGASLRLQRVQGVLALPGMGNRRCRLLHCSGNEQQGPHERDRRRGRRPHLYHRCERARAVRELEGACWPDLGDKDRGDRDACLEGNFSVFPGPGRGVGTLVRGREHPLSCLQGLDRGWGCEDACARCCSEVGRSFPQGEPTGRVDVSLNSVFREAGNRDFYVVSFIFRC